MKLITYALALVVLEASALAQEDAVSFKKVGRGLTAGEKAQQQRVLPYSYSTTTTTDHSGTYRECTISMATEMLFLLLLTSCVIFCLQTRALVNTQVSFDIASLPFYDCMSPQALLTKGMSTI